MFEPVYDEVNWLFENRNQGVDHFGQKGISQENDQILQIDQSEITENYMLVRTRLIRVKTQSEIRFLEDQFERDPTWSRETVQNCRNALNLKTQQIYKWGFDKKKQFRYHKTTSNQQ